MKAPLWLRALNALVALAPAAWATRILLAGAPVERGLFLYALSGVLLFLAWQGAGLLLAGLGYLGLALLLGWLRVLAAIDHPEWSVSTLNQLLVAALFFLLMSVFCVRAWLAGRTKADNRGQ